MADFNTSSLRGARCSGHTCPTPTCRKGEPVPAKPAMAASDIVRRSCVGGVDNASEAGHGPRGYSGTPVKALRCRPCRLRAGADVSKVRSELAYRHIRHLTDVCARLAHGVDLVQAGLDARPQLGAVLGEVQQRVADPVGRQGRLDVQLESRHGDPPSDELSREYYASASARSSRRSSLISSRSFAAYSKRSSSAAANISSSSVITSFSSSSRDIPSTSGLPRRRRPGTVGDSSDRNSAMSDTPLTIVSGVIPCSSL